MPAVQMIKITKAFAAFAANDGVDLTVMPGEIHALLGENGAGKSTLMNILNGRYRPDSGEIRLYGQSVLLRSPLDALRHKIGMVHQHFQLVDRFTVLENIILGEAAMHTRKRGWWANLSARFLTHRYLAEFRRKIEEICHAYGLLLNLEAHVWQLTMGERQRLEILKVLSREADVLILDEPTTVLTPQEISSLFATLDKLREAGCTILFITHKLSEVKEYSQHVTVMRKGRVVGQFITGEVSENDLAQAMVGTSDWQTMRAGEENKVRQVMLHIENLMCQGDKGVATLRGLNLDVHAGEIVGIAGVAGNGQEELAECVAGLRKADAGKIELAGKRLDRLTPRAISDDCKLSYIPADRLGTGVAPNLTIAENLMLKSYRRQGWWLRLTRTCHNARELIARFQIQCSSDKAMVRSLSGGNLQKLILARELSHEPMLVVAVYPTRGLDIAASKFVQETFLTLKKQGKAMLYISDDLDEIFLMSDSIAVLHRGQIVGQMPRQSARKSEIGLLMAGARIIEPS
jgi:simple sugar transport system ATP-binding protein